MADNNNTQETKELTPQQYFDMVKEKKHHATDEQLCSIYDNCLDLLNKYRITGQVSGMRKLLFHLKSIEREREIVKAGVDTFVYRDDIEDYIDNIAGDAVKIIELERYEREIPDEIVQVLERVKPLFDKFYVVFTDYTGKVERQIEREKRSRDPILFGTLQDMEADVVQRTVIERFYYIGDWVDEYCDLTLDKMVNEVKRTKSVNIAHAIRTPEDIAELREQLRNLKEVDGVYRVVEEPKKGFFSNIKTFLARKLK